MIVLPLLLPAWISVSPNQDHHVGAALAAGDFNGDGVLDVAAGAPGGGYVLTWPIAPGEPPAPGGPLGLADARPGASLLTLPDRDGDGDDELLIGAPDGAGAASIHQGSPTGLSVTAAWRVVGSDGDGLGAAAILAADISRDGVRELVIGAPRHAGGQGTLDSFDSRVTWWSPSPDLTLLGLHPPEALGAALLSADLTGDGAPDLVAGAPASFTTAADSGRVYVWLPRPQAWSRPPVTLTPSLTGGRCGAALASLDDPDADGDAELVVGCPAASTVLGWAGDPAGPAGAPAWTWSGDDLAGLGAALAVADLDGDGRDDLVAGAPSARFSDGAVAVWLDAARHAGQPPDHVLTAELPGGLLGASILLVDVSGDGLPDVLAGAPGANVGAGAVVAWVEVCLDRDIDGACLRDADPEDPRVCGDQDGDGCDDCDADDDRDGLCDAGDADGDGRSNADERRDGTDPLTADELPAPDTDLPADTDAPGVPGDPDAPPGCACAAPPVRGGWTSLAALAGWLSARRRR